MFTSRDRRHPGDGDASVPVPGQVAFTIAFPAKHQRIAAAVFFFPGGRKYGAVALASMAPKSTFVLT
jgi:hypothetical protein